MQALYTAILMDIVSLLFSHTLFDSLAITAAAFPIRLLSSGSSDRLLEMVDPRYVKSSTTCKAKSPILMLGASLMS